MNDSIFDVKAGFSQAVAALKHRNFRLFWLGQCVSLIGTWMQNMAQAWLVLELTNSAFWLGFVGTIQFLPILILSLYAGTVADRFPKKKILLTAQAVMAVLALVLALDVWLETVVLWHILIMAGMLGIANAFDMPARQSFMIELVGREDLMNAILLNSTIFNGARIIGPSVAGFLIDKLGIGWCFFLNALSFVPVIIGLTMIRLTKRPSLKSTQLQNAWQEIKAGLNFAKSIENIMVPMAMLAVLSLFAMNFSVLIPLYTKNVFHGGADKFGLLMSANGLGALAGSILLAVKGSAGPRFRTLLTAAVGACVFELLLVPVRTYALAYLLLGLTGICLITFTTTANSLVQVHTPHQYRGRVMSIYAMIFAGFSPIGSLFTGSAAHAWGAPAALGLSVIICLSLMIGIAVHYRKKFASADS